MKRLLYLVPLLLLFLIPRAATSQTVQQPTPPSPGELRITPLDAVHQLGSSARGDKTAAASNAMQRVIIRLQQPPIVEQLAPMAASDLRQSTQVAELRSRRITAQAALLDQLRKLDPTVAADYHYVFLINAISVTLPERLISQLTLLPGVDAVFFDEPYQLQLDASLQQINTATAWQLAGGVAQAGAGVKIAVIDSGIDPQNPLFSGDDFSMPLGFPKGYCVTDNPLFCNGKIISARWYGEDGDVPPGAIAQEQPTPADYSGHGSHVSAIAAGNFGDNGIVADSGDGVPEVITGVAPASQLMIYKACWNGAGCPAAALLAALEDAVVDGADLINASWGGNPGSNPTESLFRQAVANAVDAGVPIIFAAGNDGRSGAASVLCPACVAESIAVGNVTTNRVHGNRITLNGTTANDPLNKIVAIPSLEMSQTLLPISSRTTIWAGTFANETGCAPFGANHFNGSVALIMRGGCSFESKARNAFLADASAAIIINSSGGPPIRFSVGAANQIPSLMVSQSQGLLLRDWLLTHPGATLSISSLQRLIEPSWQDLISPTSAQGPNGDPTIFKPDLVAPGSNILSASTRAFGGRGFAFDSGTSMAAPHVSGAAALLLQLHPDWSPQQIKSAVTSTALFDTVRTVDGGASASPWRQGAGRLDLQRALQTQLTFAESALSQPACADYCVWRNTLRNVSDTTQIWRAEVTADNAIDVAVSPPVIALAPGAVATFHAVIDVRTASADVWQFGHIVWQPLNGGGPAAHLPLAVKAQASSPALTKAATYDKPLLPDDIVRYQIELLNPEQSAADFTVTDTLPPNVSYVPGSATGGLTFSAASRTLQATVNDLAPAIELEARDFGGYLSIASPETRIPCSGLCDDDWFELVGFDFTYLGRRYTRVFANVNGFVSLQSPAGDPQTPQQLPDPSLPNAVLAPLWTDLDLEGTAANDQGGGALYAAHVFNEVKGVSYNVIEWQDAAHWGNDVTGSSNVIHSFQIWIQRGTPFIWYTYGRLDEFGTYATSVAAEGPDGLFGDTYFFNGTGAAPSLDQDLLVVNQEPTRFSFDVRLDSGVDLLNVATAASDSQRYAARHTILGGYKTMAPLLKQDLP